MASPTEQIYEPESVKINKNLDLHLNLYKSPLLLKNVSLISSSADDGATFGLKVYENIINLRAINKNAKILWCNQIQKAIEEYNISSQLIKTENVCSVFSLNYY